MKTISRNGNAETLETVFSDDARIDTLAKEAVRDILREHKRKGQSMVVWQDSKIVTLAPEDIPVELDEGGELSGGT